MEYIVVVNMNDMQIMGKMIYHDDKELKLSNPVYVSARLSSSGFNLNMQRVTLFSQVGEEHTITIDKDNLFAEYYPSESIISYYDYVIKTYEEEYDLLMDKQLIKKQKQLTMYNDSPEEYLEDITEQEFKEMMLEMHEYQSSSNTVIH